MSKNYSIYEAKAKLSQLLRQVKEGMDVVVTERGTPVARIIPFRQGKPNMREKIEALSNKGLYRKGKQFSSWTKVSPDSSEATIEAGAKAGALKRFLDERD